MKKQILFTESEIKNKVGEIAYNLKKREHDFPPVFICVFKRRIYVFYGLSEANG
jgi:hypoxanthine-guanine phosphoribosyltransferase